jgi:hypothetical protein
MNEYLKDRLKVIVRQSLENLASDINQVIDEMPKFDRYQALHNQVTALTAENARLQAVIVQQHERNYLLVRQLERQPSPTDAVLGNRHREAVQHG